MRKPAKQMVTFLERNGYVFSHTNAKSADIYTHPQLGQFMVGSSITDHIVKNEIRNLQKRLGQTTDRQAVKRDALAIRERHADERVRIQADLDRKDAEIEAYLAKIEAIKSRRGPFSEAEWARISRLLEQHYAEQRELRRLMTEGPWNNKHEGRVKAEHVS